MKSLFNKLTTKQLLVIITILLVVIAAPVIINTFDYLSRNVSNFIVSNKINYCAREYPAHTVKALTPSEFDAFIAKEVATISTTNTYNFFAIGKYKGLSDIDAMKLFHNWRLNDTHYPLGTYRGGNSCERSYGYRIYIGDIPWYYF